MAEPGAFSAAEFGRRRRALEGALAAAGVAHGLLYGANRAGGAVSWLTGWPVTREAHVLVTPGEPDLLLVNFYNHVPNAARLASAAVVRWAGPHPAGALAEEVARRGGGPVGVIGPLPFDQYAVLAAAGRVLDLTAAYTGLRLVKSTEEVSALRRAAELTDAAAAALQQAEPGMTEHEVLARVESAYVQHGGLHHIHYLAATPMADPDRAVPAQWPTGRRLAAGDVLTCELSAAVAPEYAGQLLRTFTVAAEPTPLVAELHAVAEATFTALLAGLRPGTRAVELRAAAGLVEAAGFSTIDDLVHGFGGGYLPPVIGSAARPGPQSADLPLAAGMTVVLQPNVVTPDHRLGVQTGELVLVTEAGAESLHRFPAGLLRIGAAA